MSEFIGIALVRTRNADGCVSGIYQTPSFSSLTEGTEVKVEGFAKGGMVRGTVQAYCNIDIKSEDYQFIERFCDECEECDVNEDGKLKKVLYVTRDNPLWEE